MDFFKEYFNDTRILSLDSEEYKEIVKKCDEFLTIYLKDRKRAPANMSKEELLKRFKENPGPYLKRFYHEYGMVSYDGVRTVPIFGLPPIYQKKIIYDSKVQCQSAPKLKPMYNVQGKMSEGSGGFFLKCWLHYLGYDINQIRDNNTIYSHGGDLGSDLEFGSLKFDLKYRNDSPWSGLILRDRFLNSSPNDVIIIHTTNATSIHLGSTFSKNAAYADIKSVFPNITETIPVAISGWISKEEFMEKKQSRGFSGADNGIWVVDNLHPISELLFKIFEDQMTSNDLFV